MRVDRVASFTRKIFSPPVIPKHAPSIFQFDVFLDKGGVQIHFRSAVFRCSLSAAGFSCASVPLAPPAHSLIMKHLVPILAVAAVCSCLHSASADVKLPPAISDHMVLQCDPAAPIWGTASPSEEVTVEIAGQKKSAKADADGKWRVTLDGLKSGGPHTLTVKGKNSIAVNDVLIGEVWVGSGQSNMAGGVRGFSVNDPVLAEAAKQTYPKLRILHGGKWEVAAPASTAGFSAILFSFGVALHRDLGVPVGLYVGAVGGTPSGYWLTEEMFRADAACQQQVKQAATTYKPDEEQKKYEAALAKWKIAEEAGKLAGKPASREPAKPVAPGSVTGGKFGFLYEAHVRPFVGYGIRGVLWDQGESGTAISGADQFNVMGALIRGWRKDWGQDFPFLYVQKPSGMGCAWDLNDPVTKNASKFEALPAPVPVNGAYRELHVKIHQHPNTAMVPSTDLGMNTHPTNKSGYGERAARVALGFVYKKPVEFSGPLYVSHVVEGGNVRIKFAHTGKGLAAAQSDKLQGFAIAGTDKKFVWADAVIDGDSVLVSSAAIPNPVAVRYAWSQSIPWANLFNKDGLPAQAFRSDDWK